MMMMMMMMKMADNVSETVQDKEKVTVTDYNRKSYVACRMALIPMTLSDLVGHFSCLKRFYV